MKRIIFIIVSLFILLTAEANDIYEVTATRLNVRVSPSSKASVIGAVSKGEQLEILNIDSAGWAKIEYKNRQGFVSSKFLRFIRTNNPEPIEIPIVKEDTVEVQKEEKPLVVETDTPIRHSNNDKFSTLLKGPGRISNNFELYYGLSAGIGYSSFIWDGELASGTLTYTADLYAELFFNNKVIFIPRNYFFEFQLGYDYKGAASYPMHYIHCRLYPFGYKIPLNPIKLVGKAGLYIGFPLNELESQSEYYSWGGDFQIGISAAIGIEYKQFCLGANVEYNFTEVANTPVTLNNFAIFGTLSYKFGKLKH